MSAKRPLSLAVEIEDRRCSYNSEIDVFRRLAGHRPPERFEKSISRTPSAARPDLRASLRRKFAIAARLGRHHTRRPRDSMWYEYVLPSAVHWLRPTVPTNPRNVRSSCQVSANSNTNPARQMDLGSTGSCDRLGKSLAASHTV